MIGNRVRQVQLAKPAIRQIEMNLVTQPPFRANAHNIRLTTYASSVLDQSPLMHFQCTAGQWTVVRLNCRMRLDACEPQINQSRRLLPAKRDRLAHDPRSKSHRIVRFVLPASVPASLAIPYINKEIESAKRTQIKKSF